MKAWFAQLLVAMVALQTVTPTVHAVAMLDRAAISETSAPCHDDAAELSTEDRSCCSTENGCDCPVACATSLAIAIDLNAGLAGLTRRWPVDFIRGFPVGKRSPPHPPPKP